MSANVTSSARPSSATKICLVVPQGGKAWVLDRIAKEVCCRLESVGVVHYGTVDLPTADIYFFTHFAEYIYAIRRHPWLLNKRTSLLFTHQRDDFGFTDLEFQLALRCCDSLVAMCSQDGKFLKDTGAARQNVRVLVGAADKQKFFPSSGAVLKSDFAYSDALIVGICGRYYQRKNPELIFEIIFTLKKINFIILGEGWENAEGYTAIKDLPNFRCQSLPYEEYNSFYNTIDVLLSVSLLEGGPIPVLEALLAGTPVCATPTGWCAEVIHDGINGKILTDRPSAQEVREAILKCAHLKSHKAKISSGAQKYDWGHYTRSLEGVLLEEKSREIY